jgi:DNA-binding response OmpR family regulator
MNTQNTVLLVGRMRTVLDEVQARLPTDNIILLLATNLQEVKAAFASNTIDTVIMGAGIELDQRLEIVRHIFEASNSTTVHMKDRDSGPEGMLPFAVKIISTFATG